MKRFRLFLVTCLLTTMTATAQVVFPTLSTEGDEHWYYIQMQRGKSVLTVQGNNQNIKTAVVSASNRERQLWKITQNSDNTYSITSKMVVDDVQLKLLYCSSNSRFKGRRFCVQNDEYDKFDIVPTNYSGSENLEGYEIEVKGREPNGASYSGTYKHLNQVGDVKPEMQVGCWNYGDPNNVLQFIAEDDMQIPDAPPAGITDITPTGIASWTPPNTHTLWYKVPAENWMFASLPIGNGQFGGTVMGGIMRDEIQFNDKTLWRGHLNGLVSHNDYGYYLDFGHLYITSSNISGDVTDYRRWLDIEEAVAGVAFTNNGIDYKREYIASYPDDVIAIRYSATGTGNIYNSLILYNPNGNRPTYTIDGNTGVITFKGTVPRTSSIGNVDPESYYCQARVVVSGGSITSSPDGLTVSNADEMVVYLRGMTNFTPDNDEYIYDATLLPGKVQQCVADAEEKGYDAIKYDHIEDYKRFYNRCRLTLNNSENTKPTGQLITDYANNQADNIFLEELYFSYGRYLLISSSRGVALPNNLQGIWNNSLAWTSNWSNKPAWMSDIHSNINVQENYWPAEVTNLSELHTAFTDYIHREACVRPQWRRNAKDIGEQEKGWTLTTENNIYGAGSNWMSNYTIANAWYCMHLWQHYRYTLDTDFLRDKAWPAMKSCCDYWLGRLKLAADGTYECPDEYSPEHGPASENATAHSQQLVWDLFNNTLKAYEVLGSPIDDQPFISNLQNKFENLDNGLRSEVVDGVTLLREWKTTSQNNISTYKSHRHMSHLMGLYPGNQIDADINADIFKAAKNSVETRGTGSTGWSIGWKINLNARIGNAKNCYTIINNALKLNNSTTYNEEGGIYKNLWDAHAPFQIDGNFGTCAGIAEMLMQSHLEKIKILPALPDAWRSGKIKGLRAVNKFEVDIEWKNSKAEIIRIKSEAGKKAIVKYPNITSYCVVKESDGTPVVYDVVSDDEIEFPTVEGESYILRKGVTVTIGNTGYGTLYYGDRNLLVPEAIGVSTYKVNGNALAKSKTYAPEDVIPAETGVVLNASPATYVFFESSNKGTTDTDNLLRGFDEDNQMTTAGEGQDDNNYKFYKLTTKNGSKVGFYYGAADGEPFTMTTAHKAYLVVPKEVANNVKEFFLDEGTTDIGDAFIASGSKKFVVFDMQGRKLEQIPALKKGVYVVCNEGNQPRKVVVK